MMWEIEHYRDHKFVKGPKGTKGCKGSDWHGKLCGKSKEHPCHYGPPPSLNVAGSGANHWTYQTRKKFWQARFIELLEEKNVPKGNQSILVEGMVCFPDRHRRDMGNFRYLVEKCLGDALVEGGWLDDDSWYPEQHYEFGRLEARYEKDVAWIRLMIMPTDGM